MMKRKLKPLAILVIVCFVTLSTFTVANAAGTKKWLEAWYGVSNITYNGQSVSTALQPFAANQTTFVPLRKVCDLFGKEIIWDAATSMVVIKDKPDDNVSNLKLQLAMKDADILRLQKQVQALQKELDDLNIMDIDDLEDELNADYNEYEDVEFEITLSGDEEDVAIKLEVDLNEFDSEWDDLSTAEKTEYLQDICDKVLDEYQDANISGYIRDSSSSSTAKLLSFYTTSSGTVKLGTNSSTLSDLEDVLNADYNEYEDVEFEITLSGDEEDVAVKIEVDLDEFESEWDDLSTAEKTDFLQELCDNILDEYEDADITGYIRDSSSSSTAKLLSFYTNSSGTVNLGANSSSFSDLEDDLYDDYVSDYDDIDMTIELEGDNDELTYILNVDLGEYYDEYMDYLDDDSIEALMEDIYDFLTHEEDYEDMEIEGFVYDTDEEANIARYFETSAGEEFVSNQ